ncbi:hypothetical protein DL765_004870 [Monosporascus sp. GIB2]|nr:hypothetical protein DL765_004870 [Monosporascus sp. GIB2]
MRRAVHDSIRGLVTRAEFDSYRFDSEFRDTGDRVRTGRRIVSGGIIAVIIIVCVVFISFCVIGCCAYSRIRKRRHERRQIEMIKNNTSDNSTSYPINQNGSAPYPTYPNFGPDANNPVADPAPAYTPGHTGGAYKGPDGEAAGGYGIGHSSGHAGGHGVGHSGGHGGGL